MGRFGIQGVVDFGPSKAENTFPVQADCRHPAGPGWPRSTSVASTLIIFPTDPGILDGIARENPLILERGSTTPYPWNTKDPTTMRLTLRTLLAWLDDT